MFTAQHRFEEWGSWDFSKPIVDLRIIYLFFAVKKFNPNFDANPGQESVSFLMILFFIVQSFGIF